MCFLENQYTKQEISQCRTLRGSPSNPIVTQVGGIPYESSYQTVYEIYPLGRPSQAEYFVTGNSVSLYCVCTLGSGVISYEGLDRSNNKRRVCVESSSSSFKALVFHYKCLLF